MERIRAMIAEEEARMAENERLEREETGESVSE
jgi:hypothetical protein